MLCCRLRSVHDAMTAPQGTQSPPDRPWFVDTLLLAILIATIVAAATLVAQPELRTQAAASDSYHTLVGFWPAEQNGADIFRWSRTNSALRLFGFEQQAPVAVRLRLTAVREPNQPPALLTLAGTDPLPPVAIQPVA